MYTKLLIKIIRIQIFLYSLREREREKERENVYVRQLIYHEFKVFNLLLALGPAINIWLGQRPIRYLLLAKGPAQD